MGSGCHRRSASALKSWYAFSCSLVCQAVPYTRCSCLLRSSPRQYAPATLQAHSQCAEELCKRPYAHHWVEVSSEAGQRSAVHKQMVSLGS